MGGIADMGARIDTTQSLLGGLGSIGGTAWVSSVMGGVDGVGVQVDATRSLMGMAGIGDTGNHGGAFDTSGSSSGVVVDVGLDIGTDRAVSGMGGMGDMADMGAHIVSTRP